jgi:hypothetical protein
MGQVDPCLPEDIPAVADLHDRVFFQSTEASSEALRSYYRNVFFRNPWCDDGPPSLVYRSGGKVTGFLGCIPRRMQMGGRSIRVVILHRLLAGPDADSPLAALRLLKEMLSGPQDLTIADGANDDGQKMFEASGTTPCPLYSIKWLRPLRPCSFVLSTLAKRRAGIRSILIAARPFCAAADAIACRLPGSPFVLRRPSTRETELKPQILLKGIEEFSRSYPLRPSYDLRSLEWLLKALKDNRARGELQGFGVLDERDRLIGLSLYYLSSVKVAEIMLLASHKNARDTVLRHLMYSVWRAGGVGLVGRFEPKFLPAFAENDCFMKPGDWAFVHARDPELVHIINRGEAFLSALEGELWLHSPMNRL